MVGEFRFTPVNHPLDSSSGLGRTGDHADPGEIQMNGGTAISLQGSAGRGGSIKDRIGPSPNREDKIFLYRKKILLKSLQDHHENLLRLRMSCVLKKT